MKTMTAVLATTLAVSSCATSSGFDLTVPPTPQPQRFTAVEVAPVTADGTLEGVACPAESASDPGETCAAAMADLAAAIRRGIVDELTGSGDFALVVSGVDPAPGAVLVSCAITQFTKGSRLTRYLVGMGAGKAELRVLCGFTDVATGQPYAEGVFRGDIKGGLFGGDADGEVLGNQVGKAITEFLRAGSSG